MIIKIPNESLPVGKVNLTSLVADISSELGVDPSSIGITSVRDLDGGGITEMTVEIPPGVDAGTALDIIRNHNPAKSEVEEQREKPTIEQRLSTLESKIAALEAIK